MDMENRLEVQRKAAEWKADREAEKRGEPPPSEDATAAGRDGPSAASKSKFSGGSREWWPETKPIRWENDMEDVCKTKKVRCPAHAECSPGFRPGGGRIC